MFLLLNIEKKTVVVFGARIFIVAFLFQTFDSMEEMLPNIFWNVPYLLQEKFKIHTLEHFFDFSLQF